MTIIERAERSLDFLRALENGEKTQELQNNAAVLGQCMSVLGNRPAVMSQYTTLLQQSITVLLTLCCHNSPDVRLVAEEALNRVVVGGAPFHSSRIHFHFHNCITSDKHPRWLRAILSRVYLGKSWLRPSTGRGRIFAQSSLIRLKDIVERVKDPLLIADKGDILITECLEANLPRILKALSPYATKEEIFGLLTSLITLIDSPTASIRRNAANCIADICQYHQNKFIPYLTNMALNNLQEKTTPPDAILGWFITLKMVFVVNPIFNMSSDILPISKYMLIYHMCLHYIEITRNNHNILNATMDCLNVLIGNLNTACKLALLNTKGPVSVIMAREKKNTKGHQRSTSSISMAQSIMSTASSMANLSEDLLMSEQSDITFQGSLFTSVSQNQTPHRSVEDLSLKGMTTPDSPCDSMMSELNSEIINEKFANYLKEKNNDYNSGMDLDETHSLCTVDESEASVSCREFNNKVNIGSFYDEDIPLKYCARLLISRFLLNGYSDQFIPDRYVRVSVKASALSCLASIIDVFPDIMTMYLGSHEYESRYQNFSANSEISLISNPDRDSTDFILERNVCYQESMTDSFGQELLSKSTDLVSQASGTGSNKSGISHKLSSTIQKRKERIKSVGQDSSDLQNLNESKPQNVASTNPMVGSGVSADSINIGMTLSNFTMGSQTTASNYPNSDLLSTSIDPLTSSLDLEMIFDHFGDAAAAEKTEQASVENFNLEQMVQDMLVTTENLIKYDEELENESKKQTKQMKPNSKGLESDEALEGNMTNEKMLESESTSSDHGSAVDNIHMSENLNQHVSDVFTSLEQHTDPQIRGLVRVCIGSFLNAACDISSGDFGKWKVWGNLPDYVVKRMTIDNLLSILLKGVTDSVPQCVNHSLTAIIKCVHSLFDCHKRFILSVMNYVQHVQSNPYWLCKVNLCHFYSGMDYKRLSIILPDWPVRSWQVLESLISLLKDQELRVRRAAVNAIIKLTPDFHPPINFEPKSSLISLAREQNDNLLLKKLKRDTKLLSDYKNATMFSTFPSSLRDIKSDHENYEVNKSDLINANLKIIINVLYQRLIVSQCKYFTHGCLESLVNISLIYKPIEYPRAYCDLGILEYCLQTLRYRTLSVSCYETLLALTTQIYSAEAWNAVCHNSMNKRASMISLPAVITNENRKAWNHFSCVQFAVKADTFLKLTLRLLNIFIHIIQDVAPQPIQPKIIGIIPPSPLKKRNEEAQKRNTGVFDTESPSADDKSKKKASFSSTSGLFMPHGYFYKSVLYMKMYANLKSAYSTHKVSVDSSSSVFLNFMSTVLSSLGVQLEYLSDHESEKVSEEILYYLKYLLPLKPDSVVSCVTQLVKSLFSVNLTAQRRNLQDFLFETNASQGNKADERKNSYYEEILVGVSDTLSFDSVVNFNEKVLNLMSDTVDNRLNNKLIEGYGKNSHLQAERDCYASIKKYSKSKSDKEWTIHQQEYGRYLKLIEPIVVQALKGYVVQNNISMQCKVLELVNQILSLKVNYCFLNSDKTFIDIVLKQLEFIERGEMFDCTELVRSIFTFLIHLSTTEHHTKQLMDIPKLMQLCDGLMASEVYDECIQSLHPLAYKIFIVQPYVPGQNRVQYQEAQVTKEVLFSMLQKMMRDTIVIKLLSTVLIFSEEHPESHYKWSQLVCDSLFQMLKNKSIEINNAESYVHLDKLFDCIHKQVLFDQSKIESILRIIFDSPPDQECSLEIKERWLATIVLFLQKIISDLPENEILLSINYLKTSFVSPASIFFNSHNEIDPLNVQTVNENCANLSPDVIFVRFLFRALSYALLELENRDKFELSDVKSGHGENYSFWCTLCNMLICQMKNILNLKEGCRFPLLTKTAQTVLHNEQSGLNTGLYAPEENIPLKRLATVCIKLSLSHPIITVHWCHLLIRLRFHEKKFMIPFLGFTNNTCMHVDVSNRNLNNDILQVGVFLALCEHFVNNGLDEVVDFTWLLVNRIHFIIQFYDEEIVKELVEKINKNASASGLLLQAIATRCQPFVKGTYGLKAYSILSQCHPSQTGSLLFCICRFIGRLPISISPYFMKLALKRCKYLATLSVEEACEQIPLDDIQIALELLHNDRIDKRYPELVYEFNNLACTIYNLSPLDIPLDRPVNPHNIKTTSVDMDWLLSQIKARCYKYCNDPAGYGKNLSIASVLQALSVEDLNSLFNSTEFNVDIIQHTIKIGTDQFVKELSSKIMEQEYARVNRRKSFIERQISENEEFTSKDGGFMDGNIFGISTISKLRKLRPQSHFFVPISNSTEESTDAKSKESFLNSEKCDVVLPETSPLLTASLKYINRLVLSVVALFPKNFRPLSQFETGLSKQFQTMDKYTKRCFVVFRDKYFHQLLLNVQGLVGAFVAGFEKVLKQLEHVDIDSSNKVIDTFLPKHLCVNLMQFSIISLQYSSYLIKNHEDFDMSQMNAKFEQKDFDHVLDLCVKNASRCFGLKLVWLELDTEDNKLKLFSAINCLYNYVKYLVKDHLPIEFMPILSKSDKMDDSIEVAWTCDKLLTLIAYWEKNPSAKLSKCMSSVMKDHIESLMVSLCRCKLANSFTLIPPNAWDNLQIFGNDSSSKKNETKSWMECVLSSDLAIPIDLLQDMDMLERYLYRANMIGWTTKKGFEEIWVSYLGALQGNGTHWAVRGMMQLLLGAGSNKCSRDSTFANSCIQKMKQISLDCNFFDELFEDVNLENVPYDNRNGYNYSQVSVDYLKHAAGLNDFPDIKVQHALTQSRKVLQMAGIDIASCIQLLIDIASQVFTQSDWGLGAKNALLSCLVNISDIFTTKIQWQWLSQQLSQLSPTYSESTLAQSSIILGNAKVQCVLGSETPDVGQLIAAMSSSFAPIRISGLHAAIMHLSSYNEVSMLGADQVLRTSYEQFNSALEANLLIIIKPHLSSVASVSYYEQSLYWSALFALINCGNNELIKIAVDFYFSNQNHFCADLILRGIYKIAMSKGGTLGNDVNSIIFKAVETNPEMCYRILPLLLIQIYAGNDVQKSESNLEPEQLLMHLQIFATLQRSITLSPANQAGYVCKALLNYLRDFLPPAAVLNKIVIEFMDCCRWADTQNYDRNVALTRGNAGLKLAPFYIELLGNVVFEVFEESIAQDQLLIFNGWLFDGLNHFLEEKISADLTPYCLLSLVTSASSNKYIRMMSPVVNHILRTGCTTSFFIEKPLMETKDESDSTLSLIPQKVQRSSRSNKMNFNNTRLLCVGAMHSNFTKFQLDKLRSLCVGKPLLNDLRLSLDS